MYEKYMKLMCEQHQFSYESHMHFLLYGNHIISYYTHVITSYASHMTAFLYKSFHVKFIFILYDNYVWRNWLCIGFPLFVFGSIFGIFVKIHEYASEIIFI